MVKFQYFQWDHFHSFSRYKIQITCELEVINSINVDLGAKNLQNDLKMGYAALENIGGIDEISRFGFRTGTTPLSAM